MGSFLGNLWEVFWTLILQIGMNKGGQKPCAKKAIKDGVRNVRSANAIIFAALMMKSNTLMRIFCKQMTAYQKFGATF